MKIDWTISLGTLIPILTMLVAFFIALHVRLKTVETKVEAVWGWFTGQIPNIPGTPQRRHQDRVFESLRDRDALIRDDGPFV